MSEESYDPAVPEQLKETQDWFAGIITQPIDDQSHIAPTAPSGNEIEKEAKEYISPSPTLKSHQRIELYNQQYWWRLLNTLHSSFPLATRLLGYQSFNRQIAFPYLQKHPSHHWSLSFLGDKLPQWMEEDFEGEDKEFLQHAVSLDWAFCCSFFAAHIPFVKEGESPDDLFLKKGVLQPHLHLLKFPYDLLKFRSEVKLKEPDFWSGHHYPNLKHALSAGEEHFPALSRDKTYYYVLWRNPKQHVVTKEISKEEFLCLEQFKSPASIDDLLVWIDTREQSFKKTAKIHLQNWIQQWVGHGWLGAADPSFTKT